MSVSLKGAKKRPSMFADRRAIFFKGNWVIIADNCLQIMERQVIKREKAAWRAGAGKETSLLQWDEVEARV